MVTKIVFVTAGKQKAHAVSLSSKSNAMKSYEIIRKTNSHSCSVESYSSSFFHFSWEVSCRGYSLQTLHLNDKMSKQTTMKQSSL